MKFIYEMNKHVYWMDITVQVELELLKTMYVQTHIYFISCDSMLGL